MDLRNALNKYITISSEILGGTPVFKGSRVPIKILFDYLQGGDNINEFFENYPSVNQSYVKNILSLYLTEIESNESVA